MTRTGQMFFNAAYTAFVSLVYLFLYIPIAVLIIFSFNNAVFPEKWVGFSLRWYYALFQSSEIWIFFKNSLIVASAAVVLSLTMALFFIYYTSRERLSLLLPTFYLNLVIPELVIAVGLLTFFSFCAIPLGLTTLVVGHTLIGLGYAIPIIYTRFAEIDPSLIEASLDLGATQSQTFYRVILPLLKPAIVAAGLLVFIISFDNFLISFFCSSSSSQTLSLYIFAMIRTGVTPTINALSTLLLLISSILVLAFSSLRIRVF